MANRYLLKKDVEAIGKAGTICTWSLQSQLEYAHLVGIMDKWPEIFNEFFELIKEEPAKDWEIVEYWNAGGWHPPTNDCKQNGCRIHSVRRLSDNELFSVGDDVTWNGGNHGRIESFQILSSNNKMIAKMYFVGVGINNITLASKAKEAFQWDDAKVYEFARMVAREYKISPTWTADYTEENSLAQKFKEMKQSLNPSLPTNTERVKDIYSNEVKYWMNTNLKYSQIEMDKAIEDAFAAAREEKQDETGFGGIYIQRPKYATIQSYLKSLKVK